MEFTVKLPAAFTKRYNSQKLKDAVADEGMWFGRPLPTTPEGRDILKMNEPLFKYCDTIDSFDYDFEPVSGCLFEMIPPSTSRQGVGIGVDYKMNILELDIYFFPCDYSEDEKRILPFTYVRQPIASTANYEIVDNFVRKYFSIEDREDKIAVIPFSFERVAILEGNFIDDYKATEKICRDAVKGGSMQELKNCDEFLEFIKNVGYK